MPSLCTFVTGGANFGVRSDEREFDRECPTNDRACRDSTLKCVLVWFRGVNTTEEALSNPLTSAVSGALSTALGALIPILPFFFVGGYVQ